MPGDTGDLRREAAMGWDVLRSSRKTTARAADLPVVVATRMSLSFPVLVSAVPLYTVRRSAVDRLRAQGRNRLEPGDLQRNWFSDGGIASNFPIHLFDN
ncbi:MAG: hypothetical protein C4314_03515, partial [Thermoflexus sp.]